MKYVYQMAIAWLVGMQGLDSDDISTKAFCVLFASIFMTDTIMSVILDYKEQVEKWNNRKQ